MFLFLTFLALVLLSSTCDSQSAGDVRLVGSHPWSGRLETYYSGRWGGVCDDHFSENDAIVVCRQIGFPTVRPVFATVKTQLDDFVMDELKCTGNEISILDCKYIRNDDCAPTEHVSLTCESHCEPNRCNHGGVCQSQLRGYECKCTGFWGANCDFEINECDSNNGGCSHKCVNTFGSYHCECPYGHMTLANDNHTCHIEGVNVTCTSESMEVTFSKTQFPGLHAQYMTLDDSTCTARDSPAHIDVTIPLDGCGTEMQNVGSDMVFENEVTSRDVTVSGLVSHVRDMNVTVRCLYNEMSVAQNYYLVPTDQLTYTAETTGHYDVKMDLIHNGIEYHSASPFPLSINPGEKISIKFTLLTNDSNLQVFARECIATPTSDVNNPVKYTLLKEGCGHDSTLSIDNGTSTEEIISLDTFKFINQSDTVYFHCNVLVCDVTDPGSRCQHGCQGRHRREADEIDDVFMTSHNLSSGLIVVNRLSEGNEHAAKYEYLTPVVVSGTLFLVSALTLMLAFYILFSDNHKPHHSNIPKSKHSDDPKSQHSG